MGIGGMRIGVISDTHDRLPTIDRGLEVLRERGVEAILHPGDVVAPFAAKRLLAWTGPLYITYGNNDGERKGLRTVLPQIQDGPLWVELAGRRILLHHYLDWCQPEQIARADIVVTGHTHEVVNERRDGRLFLNPGECCGWLYGRCTVAVLESDTLSAEIIEVPQ
jgi:putative phosphoesterase